MITAAYTAVIRIDTGFFLHDKFQFNRLVFQRFSIGIHILFGYVNLIITQVVTGKSPGILAFSAIHDMPCCTVGFHICILSQPIQGIESKVPGMVQSALYLICCNGSCWLFKRYCINMELVEWIVWIYLNICFVFINRALQVIYLYFFPDADPIGCIVRIKCIANIVNRFTWLGHNNIRSYARFIACIMFVD